MKKNFKKLFSIILCFLIMSAYLIIPYTGDNQLVKSIKVENKVFAEDIKTADPDVAAPTFNIPEGTYTSKQTVTINCAISGATIRYTTDGTEPTDTSPVYIDPIIIAGNKVIKAVASVSNGTIKSQVASASYKMRFAAGDVNGDGGIDCIDYSLIKKYLLDSAAPLNYKAADLNDDDKIDSVDFILMRQYLIGLIDKFPKELSSPTRLTVQSNTAGITISWQPPVEATNISSYEIYRDGFMVGSATTTAFTDNSGLKPGANYTYMVIAVDISGNDEKISRMSGQLKVTAGANTDLFEFKIKISDALPVYYFPIKSESGTYDIVVDWGDGSISKITRYSTRVHEYASAGTYIVKVISYLKMPISFKNDKDLIEVITPIPDIGATSFNDCFRNCSSLTTIPSGLFDNNVNVTSFAHCFDNCNRLATIPSGLFDNNINVTDFDNCFTGCISLTAIPEGLFDKNVEAVHFYYLFSYCHNLKAIPEGLFNKNVNVTDFSYCFFSSSITAIPAGLFEKNVKVTNFENCFSGSRSFTTIPAGLFDKNVNVISFEHCFSDCASLTVIPAGLFDKNVNVTNFNNCFSMCRSLMAIPAGLFDKNAKVTNFNACFSDCRSLTSIPAGLFDNNTNVADFSSCFSYCSSLTGLAPDLWLRSPNPKGKECFYGCTGLSNYADIPSDWKEWVDIVYLQ